MEAIAIFKFIFGNLIAVGKTVNEIVSFDSVAELNDKLFNSLILSIKNSSSDENRIDSQKLIHILRLHRKEVMSLFENLDFAKRGNKVFADESFNRELAFKIKGIIVKFDDHVDSEILVSALSSGLYEFQRTIYNNISEKQGIHLLLNQSFEIDQLITSGFDGISAEIDKQKEGLTEIKEVGISNSMMLQSLMASQNKKEIEITGKAINTVVASQLQSIDRIVESHEYDTAIDQLSGVLEDNNNLSNRLKQRIYNKLAFCYEQTGDLDNLILSLKQCLDNCDDELEKSFIKFSLGRIQKKPDELAQIAASIKEEDYQDVRAFIIGIEALTFERKEDIDNFVSSRGQGVVHTMQSYYSIARKYYDLQSINLFIHYAKKAISIAEAGKSFLQLSTASKLSVELVNYYIQNPLKEITSDHTERLRLAEDMYKAYINSSKVSNGYYKVHEAVINLSLIYASRKDFEKALTTIDFPSIADIDDQIAVYKAFIYFWSGDVKNAKRAARALFDKNNKAFSTHSIQLISILLTESTEVDIKYAFEFVQNNAREKGLGNQQTALEAYLLGKHAIEQRLATYADSIMSLIGATITNWTELLKAIYLHHNNELNDLVVDGLFKFSNHDELFDLELSDFLISSGDRNRAFPLLDSIKKGSPYYLRSSYLKFKLFTGQDDHSSLFRLCKEAIEEFGHITPFYRCYINSLFQYKEYQEILNLQNAQLAFYPNDFEAKLITAHCQLALSRQDEVDVESLPSCHDLIEVHHLRQLAYLYINLGLRDKLFDMPYTIWRRFKTKEYCELIIYLSNQLSVTQEELTLDRIGSHCKISTVDDDDTAKAFIIYDEEDAKYDPDKEINRHHPLYKKLVGKSNGDQIKLGRSPYTGKENSVTITGIQTLHQYAFLAALERIGTQYKGESAIYTISGKSPKDSLDKIFEIIDAGKEDYIKNNQLKAEYLNKYINWAFPMCSFSRFFNINPVSFWYACTDRPNIGIRISKYQVEENKSMWYWLNTNRNVCLSIPSILSIFHSNQADQVSQIYKLVVAQSTYDVFREIIEVSSSSIGMSSLLFDIKTVGLEGTLLSLSSDNLNLMISSASDILAWIKSNCIIKSTTVLKLEKKGSEVLHSKNIFGDSMYDTILLAEHYGFVLAIDNFAMTSVLKSEDRRMIVNSIALLDFAAHLQPNTIFSIDLYKYYNRYNLKTTLPRLDDLYYLLNDPQFEEQFLKCVSDLNDQVLGLRLSFMYLTYLAVMRKTDVSAQAEEAILKLLNKLKAEYSVENIYKSFTRVLNNENIDVMATFPYLRNVLERWHQLELLTEMVNEKKR